MVIKSIIRKVIKGLTTIAAWAEEKENKGHDLVFQETEMPKLKKIYSVWDFIEFNKDSQADHLSKVVGFDEWITMGEIRRRIKEVMGVEYLNERSLYPYIKTLVDVGFFEASNVGGLRKWKKNEFLFEISEDYLLEKTEYNKEKKRIRILSKN